MFTALTVKIKKRKSLCEKLHLVRKYRILTNEIFFCENKFFTAEISSYKEDTAKKIINRCMLPVIMPDSDAVLKYKYTVMLNTVLKIYEKKKISAALYDRNCDIIHLLPTVLQKCRSVYVFTENISEYEKENDRIYSSLGAAAVISDRPVIPKSSDIVISSEDIKEKCPVFFGQYGFFVDSCVPILDVPLPKIPEYADLYTVLSGLNQFSQIESIAGAYCNCLVKDGVKYSIKNLP